MSTQSEKADRLLWLHHRNEFLVLPNIWNPIGARILEAEGYPAVATASAAVSASLGYRDGEHITRSTLMDLLGRITGSVDVPVTADIEAGYASNTSELEDTIRQVIDSGVVGINLEDSIKEGGNLRSTPEQCERISAVRRTADGLGVHLVINARTDAFLSANFPDKSKALEEAAARAAAYVEAGADCVYPIGPRDEPTVRALRGRISAPINILASPSAAPLAVLRQLGVNRVSFGPYVFRSCLQRFVTIARGLRNAGDYTCLGTPMTSAEVGQYLRDERE
jgi:2-methylisocitrate lyase-like PEP mutase family enzyme